MEQMTEVLFHVPLMIDELVDVPKIVSQIEFCSAPVIRFSMSSCLKRGTIGGLRSFNTLMFSYPVSLQNDLPVSE